MNFLIQIRGIEQDKKQQIEEEHVIDRGVDMFIVKMQMEITIINYFLLIGVDEFEKVNFDYYFGNSCG